VWARGERRGSLEEALEDEKNRNKTKREKISTRSIKREKAGGGRGNQISKKPEKVAGGVIGDVIWGGGVGGKRKWTKERALRRSPRQ